MRTIEISHRTIIFAVLFLVFLWVLYQISSIIIGLFVAVLLTTAINPLVDKLTKFKIPRGIAILVVYLFLIMLFSLGLTSVVPPLIDQTTSLVNRIPGILDSVGPWFEGLGVSGVDGKLVASQVSQLGAIPANLVRFASSVLSNVIAVFTVLVITFYLVLERRNLDKYLLLLFGQGGEARARGFVNRLEDRLGGWVRGEMILMFAVGILTYIGLSVLRIPFALPLALLAGILEIVPTVGPTLSAIPAVLVALTISPVMGIATASLYFLVQQLENTVLFPKVMQKAAGVNPVVTIISLAIGFQLAGVMGAVLAVPVVITLQVIARYFFSMKWVGGA